MVCQPYTGVAQLPNSSLAAQIGIKEVEGGGGGGGRWWWMRLHVISIALTCLTVCWKESVDSLKKYCLCCIILCQTLKIRSSKGKNSFGNILLIYLNFWQFQSQSDIFKYQFNKG